MTTGHSLFHLKMYIKLLLSTLNIFLLDGWMDGQTIDEEPQDLVYNITYQLDIFSYK